MPRESKAARRERAAGVLDRLRALYPDASTELEASNPYELLIATILSAQCTDKMVNSVTPALFARFPDAKAMSQAETEELEVLIRSTGFFRQKTKSLINASTDIVEKFGGEVPRTLEELTTLRGAARKTANVVLGNAFDIPGLTVDTHMKRINTRLGLTRNEDPVKIERDLMELVPQKDWTWFSHRVIHHGRQCCDARKPRCEQCPLRSDCPWPDSAAARASKKKRGSRKKPTGPPGGRRA